jgi:membrane associated rhomboid family serine protease
MANSLPVPELNAYWILLGSIPVVTVLAWIVKPLYQALVLIPERLREGQIHRLITPAWVHSDIGHLAVNCLSLYFFGDNVRRNLGDARFFILYGSAIVVAHIPTVIRFWNKRRFAFLGASGAVSAIIFSAILFDPRLKLYLLFIPFAVPGWVFGLLYLAYSVFMSIRAKDRINHDAHFAGAAYGLLFTYLVEREHVTKVLQSLF